MYLSGAFICRLAGRARAGYTGPGTPLECIILGRRPPLPLLLSCIIILMVAAASGLIFNLVMPQGVGWLPSYVSRPLWQKADLVEAVRLQKQGAMLVDARDAGDYKLARAAGAVNLYPDEIKLLWPLLKQTLSAAPAVVVYGRYTSRWPAARIGQFLRKQGLPKVYVLDQGLDAWRAAGLPVKTPRRSRP